MKIVEANGEKIKTQKEGGGGQRKARKKRMASSLLQGKMSFG